MLTVHKKPFKIQSNNNNAKSHNQQTYQIQYIQTWSFSAEQRDIIQLKIKNVLVLAVVYKTVLK